MSSSTVFSGITKIYHLLESKDRRRWLWMITLALFLSCLEMITASLVMVFAQVLNDPNFGFHYLQKWNLPSLSQTKLILSVSVLVGCVFFIKNGIALFETFFQNFSTQKMSYELQKRILNRYSQMDYQLYLKRNSSEWHLIISSDIDQVFTTGMSSFSLFFSEMSIFICLVTLMIFVNPSLAGVIFGFGAILYFLVKKRLFPLFYRWGEQQQAAAQKANQHLYQFFHAFKEMIILGKKDFFIERYGESQVKKNRLIALKTSTTVVPRLVMETLFVILFVIAVSYLCIKSQSPKDIMGILGGYLYLGFRLMPGLNRMIAQMSLFKSAMPSINRVFEEYQRAPTGASMVLDVPEFQFEEAISFNQVDFSYLGSQYTLKNISLDIKKGECIGIIGETGSGKSTFIDILLGLLTNIEGSVLVDGKYPVHSKQWHSILAYVPQTIYLTDDTIEANIAFGEDETINGQKLQQAIDDAQLRTLIERLPKGLKTLVGERGIRLSGGEKQRIAIARALYRNAQVFIFDEATSALDNETETRLMEVLNTLRKDRTFIMVAHRLTTLKNCDRIIVLNSGKMEKIVTYQDLGAMIENV